MKRALIILALILSPVAAWADKIYLGDLADVAQPLRVHNWPDPNNGQGSCVHASFMTILYYRGLDAQADWWGNTYSGGEYDIRIVNRVMGLGIPFAYTMSGDTEFLDYCSRNRLGAIIWFFPSHCVTLVDLTATEAVLLDNNRTDRYLIVPREEFLFRWRNIYGGFALTIITPPPPPWVK